MNEPSTCKLFYINLKKKTRCALSKDLSKRPRSASTGAYSQGMDRKRNVDLKDVIQGRQQQNKHGTKSRKHTTATRHAKPYAESNGQSYQ